jgi:hypothetical protein
VDDVSLTSPVRRPTLKRFGEAFLNRRLLLLCAVQAVVACTGGPPGSSPSPGSLAPNLDAPLPKPMPDILARVNGHPVTARQVVPLAKKTLDKGNDQDREARKPRALREALHDYVDRELLFAESLERGLRADDRVVQYAYDRARVDHPNDQEWAETLSSQGFDVQGYKDELRAEETIKALLREIAGPVSVTDEEARARYEAHREDFPAPAGKADFAAVKEQVKARIIEEKSQPRLRELIKALRAKARIETYI